MLHERWIQNLIEDDAVVVFVHRDDNIVTGYVTVQRKAEARQGHIGLIAVDPEYCGKGIGGRLLQSAESDMMPPLHKLSVMTERMNTRVLRLYARAGYSVCRSWDVWHACRGDDSGQGRRYGSVRS